MQPSFHLSVSVFSHRTYRAKHIARLLEPALSRSRINRPIWIALSILLSLLSNHLLKITAPMTRGVSTSRSNNQKLWLISQSFEFVVFLCPILSHQPFFFLLIFSSFFLICMMIRISSTKLKKNLINIMRETYLANKRIFIGSNYWKR